MAAETFRITEELTVEDKTGSGLASAQRKVSEFDKTVQETQSRLNKLTGSRWSVAFSAVDKATSVIAKAESKISSVVGKAWNFTVGVIDKATAPLQSIFNMLRNPLLQAGAVLGISVSVSDSISTFSGFEATMSKVKAISNASTADMEELTALAQEMGKTTKFTATEAAEGLTYMAMAGWKTESMLTSLPGIMNLAAAAGEDLATTSDIVTDAMTAFGMAADGYTASGVSNATHFADVLAAASSGANTTVSGMGDTFKYVGSMAGALGYSIEDVALATGLMANQGVKGTMAGTALNSMLTRLSTNTSGAADAISALGVEFYNSDGSARSLGDVMGELRKATVGMTAAQKAELANTVAGTEAQKGFLAILNTTEDEYNTLADSIYNCDGAAEQMADTMMDNLQGSITYLQSAFDGVKMTLGSRLSPYLRQFVDWLTTKMPDVENVINNVMDTIDGKVEALKTTIAEFTSSDEWANADIWGKISIAWDKIVAEPFSAWWDSSGKPWLTEKVAGFGETLGSGISAGLLAILGFDASGAIEDGKSIGASFIEGFKDGFDTEKISEALTEWANDHKGIVAAAGVIAGGKLLGGISRAFQGGKELIGGIGSLFGKGSSGSSGAGNILGTYTTSTMTVTAGTVIVNGSNASSAARNIVQRAASDGTAALPSAGGMLSLPGAGGGQLALPGSGGLPALPGGTAAAGGLTSAGSWLSKLLTVGSKSSVIGADGTLLAVQGGIGGTLGSIGGALGSGATTAAGAAAAGSAAIGGGLLGGAGIISGLIDIFKGTRTSGKEAQDKYATGGTKIGMVGAGAAAGAAIGSVVPVVGTGIGALVGAGIGGLGALFGGDSIGKKLSDSLDEGGWLNNAGKAIGSFASKAGDKIGGFFTETLPGFVTETIPAAASKAGKAISGWASDVGDTVGNFFTETVPTFLTEQVPYAAGYVFGAAETFFTQTVPEKFTEMWDSVSTFFGETLPTWADGVFQRAQTFFTESVPEFFGNLWDNVSSFFTETIPTWADGVFQRAQTFFTETVPGFFGDLWNNVTTFVTETIPAWAEGVYQKAATFFGTTLPGFFGSLWESVTGFVTETIPAWASTAYTKVSTFFTTTVPGFFDTLWSNVTGFVTETLSSWASSIASKVSGWWSTVSGWFDSLWSTVSGAFSAGKSAGSGKHAEGGIMYAPHMAQVAEDGPEAIIPLGSADRSRGMAVWEQAGDILGVNSPEPVGSNDDGSNDFPADGPESGPEGGGDDDPIPVYPTTAGGGTGPGEAPQDAPVSVPVNITLNPEIVIQATAGMSADDIIQVLKEHIRELVDDISDEMAEKLARIFANMPVKGGT